MSLRHYIDAIQLPWNRVTGWTASASPVKTLAMGRYRHQVYTTAKSPRFCVVFDLQWQVIESVQLAPATELATAMNAAIQRQSQQGWLAESSHEFGFVFLQRARERRLLILTERDPYDTRPQSFSPFGAAR